MAKQTLLARIIIRFVFGFGIMGALLFWPAGTLSFPAGWMFLGAMFLPGLFYTLYFYKHDRAFLERRMKMKEEQAVQKSLIKYMGIIYILGFMLPGFDFRYGWSQIPLEWIIAGNVVIVFSFILVFFVFKENSYAARTIEIFEGQEVISTGPYAMVRHPMYTAVLLMFFAMPLALGTYWLFIPVVFSPLMFYFRIKNEEEVLREGLEGYIEYTDKVRYRLFPYVW